MIPLARPLIEDDDISAVVEALKSGYLVQGPRVAAFEQACADAVGAAHAVAVSSGTAALHVALICLGVGPGSRVAVPTFSWPATANVVELCGAEPVFVDIETDTFAMSPAALASALSDRQVDVVMPVHPFGVVANMTAIAQEAQRCGAVVVEDAACALGAEREGRQAGLWSDAGCFSFHPRKAVTTAEGGMIVTSDPLVARRARVLRNHGLAPDSATPDFEEVGFNYRLTEVQAALGTLQLAKLNRVAAMRERQAAIYGRLLNGSGLTPQVTPLGSRSALQSYVTLLPEAAASSRPRLIQLLRDRGIETTIGTHHVPLTRTYQQKYGFKAGDFPVTDDVAARALTLPLFPGLTESDQESVVSAVNDVLAYVAS